MRSRNIIPAAVLTVGTSVLLALGLHSFDATPATAAQSDPPLITLNTAPDPSVPSSISPSTAATTTATVTSKPSTRSTSAPTKTTASAASSSTSVWIRDPNYVNRNPVLRDEVDYGDASGNPVTIRPGTVITQYTDASKREMARCTVAFAGRLADGTKIAVTAGHCPEDHGQPVMNHDAGDQVIGRYRVWQVDGLLGSENDATGFAVIELLPNVVVGSDTPHGTITGVGRVEAGDRVCKIGSTTGLTCGDVSYAGNKSLIINLRSEAGDSGGPIIRYLSNNTFELVGILNGQITYSDGPVRVVANPFTNMLSSLRKNVDPDVKVYVE